MEESDLTPRQYYEHIRANPSRAKFGFGRKAALVNIDLQKAYTAVGKFKTAYETHPKQLDYINELADIARSKGLPVIWTHVGYMKSGEDAGIWGTRTDTPDSLQNIKLGDERFEFADHGRVIADGNVRFGPLIGRHESELFKSPRLASDLIEFGEVTERRTAPHCHCRSIA